MKFDNTDIQILAILQKDGRIKNTKLAAEIGVSAPAMLERVKRINKSGVVERYTALLDRKKVGLGILAIIFVRLGRHQIENQHLVKQQLTDLDEVLECFQITGDIDFLLKVAVKDMQSYAEFANNKLANISGIQNIQTSFVLETLKSTTCLPLGDIPIG